MADANLKELFERVKLCFPEEQRALFREPSGATVPRNDHATRWFAVTDGQPWDAGFWEGFPLLSASESAVLEELFESLREDSESYWVLDDWVAIAVGPCGDHLMLDGDGQVLFVSHETGELNELLASSIDEWLHRILADMGGGVLVCDPSAWFTSAKELAEALEREALQRDWERSVLERSRPSQVPALLATAFILLLLAAIGFALK